MIQSRLLARALLCGTIVAGAAITTASAQSPTYMQPAQMPAAEAPKEAMSVAPPAPGGMTAPAARPAKMKGAMPQADMLIKAMGATKHSKDGKDTEIGVPARLQQMLMARGKQSEVKVRPIKEKGKLNQVQNTEQYPYSTMGVFANGCPGVLVSKVHVLTAAYCVFNINDGKWQEKLDFFPGYNGDKAPFGSVTWKNVYAPTGYTKDKIVDFNFAIVELSEAIGDKTGWMGFSHFPDFSQFKQLTLTSYPYEGVPQFTEWQTDCKIGQVQDGYFTYTCPGDYKTVTAMGGGPMWFHGKTDSDWWVTGIHIGAMDDKKSHWAVRLNEANAQLALSWMNPKEETGDEEATNDEDKKCTCEDKTGDKSGGTSDEEEEDEASKPKP